jgi:hypothetical protein
MDFGKPVTGDNYSTGFVPNIIANQQGLAQWLDSANTAITGSIPSAAKRYNATSTAIEQWNGSAWSPIPIQGLSFTGGALGVGGSSGGARFEVLTGTGGFNAINARFNASNSPIGFGVANSNGYAYLANNAKQVSGTDGQVYDINSTATQLRMDGGSFVFNRAASGSAGAAISWTEVARLTSSSGTNTLRVTTSAGGGVNLDLTADAAYAAVSSVNGVPLVFNVAAAERARLDTSGNWLVGTASPILGAANRGNITVNGTTDSILSFGAGGSRTAHFYSGSVYAEIDVAGARSFQLNTNGVLRFSADSGGNVEATSGNLRGRGALSFSNATSSTGITLATSAGLPYMAFYFSGAAADNKVWDFYVDSTTFNGRVVNDGNSAAQNWLSVARSGTTISSITFPQGSVGIGGVPGQKLDIQSALSTNGAFGLRVQDTTAAQSLQLLRTGPTYSYAGVSGNESWLYSQGASSLCLGPDGAGSVKVVTNGSKRLEVDNAGRLSGTALHNNASGIAGTTNQYVGSGATTPTLTGTANVGGTSNQSNCVKYLRDGNSVSGSSLFVIVPTASATLTTVSHTLPIASNLPLAVNAGTLVGVATMQDNATGTLSHGLVSYDAINDLMLISFTPTTTNGYTARVLFFYEVL